MFLVPFVYNNFTVFVSSILDFLNLLPSCFNLLSTAITGVHLQIKVFPVKDFVFVIIL